MEQINQTLTVTQAAKVLGVSRGVAYESVRSGQIPAIRLGKRLLVPVIALERLLRGERPEVA